MYVATRGLFRMRLPTIFVPVCIADLVARLFEVHRHGPVRARAQARATPGWGGVPAQEGPQGEGVQNLPSQGYVVYAVKQKLKQEYLGLPGSEIKRLKLSGVEVCLHWWKSDQIELQFMNIIDVRYNVRFHH